MAVLKQSDPAKGRCLTQLYATSVLRAKHNGYPFPYASSCSPRFGRLYPQSASGAKISKAAGLILFGDSHVEIDMVGAHLGIFIELLRKHIFHGQPPPSPFASVSDARAFLTNLFQRTRLARMWPTYAKHLWPIALNSPNCVSHILSIVMRANVLAPPALRDALTTLIQLKARLSGHPLATDFSSALTGEKHLLFSFGRL